MGRKLNPQWNEGLARTALERLKIPLTSTVSKLSGGQQRNTIFCIRLSINQLSASGFSRKSCLPYCFFWLRHSSQ